VTGIIAVGGFDFTCATLKLLGALSSLFMNSSCIGEFSIALKDSPEFNLGGVNVRYHVAKLAIGRCLEGKALW